MPTRHFFLTCLAVFPAWNLGAQESQTSGTVRSDSGRLSVGSAVPCSYDSCALRLTLGGGNWHIARGEESIPVGNLGTFRSLDLASLLSSSPEALPYARTFQRNYVPGGVLMFLGGAVAGISLFVSSAQDWHLGAAAVGAGGLGLLYFGARKQSRGIDALSKALWIYNRTLAR
ncbi:MAG: hypothetical protein ACR2L6_12175 [Gemmatimonadaceae bacterium]